MVLLSSFLRWTFAILFGIVAFHTVLTQDVMAGLLILAGSALLAPAGGRATAEVIPLLKSATSQIITACLVIVVGTASAAPPHHNTATLSAVSKSSSPSYACETGSPANGDIVQVIGADSQDLLTKPGGNKILNEKATGIIGAPVYQSIDNSTKVQVQCIDGAWTRVQVITPEWLAHQQGWVRTAALALDTADGKQREFTEADFSWWDANTKNSKALIVDTVNRIHREDKRCKDSIQPGSVATSPSRTKSEANPVFFVTCGDGANAVNVYFDAARAKDPTPFSPPIHLARATAVQLCESYAKSKANHPSTVSFSRFMDISVTEHPNGRTTVLSSFTAKNSFNLDLTFNIRCLLDANGFIEGAINEAS